MKYMLFTRENSSPMEVGISLSSRSILLPYEFLFTINTYQKIINSYYTRVSITYQPRLAAPWGWHIPLLLEANEEDNQNLAVHWHHKLGLVHVLIDSSSELCFWIFPGQLCPIFEAVAISKHLIKRIIQLNLLDYLTFILSPSTSTVLIMKSTPIVAPCPGGKRPFTQ